MRDYYEVLGVRRDCDASTLKSAFRKLAMEHHPDRNGGCEQAGGRFKEINEAYSVLSDPQKRATYDRFGHAGLGQMNGGGYADPRDIFSEVFGDVFGDMFGRGQRGGGGGPARGQDLRYDLEITLEQAYRGTETEVRVPAAVRCEACEGSGAAAGSAPSTCVACAGAGRIRRAQGFFQMETTCQRCGGAGRVILNPCRTCGGHGQVRRERVLSVRVPPGVDDGARIRLAGEGDAGARGGPRGDLYIFLSVQPHELFERDGLDLLCTLPAPMTTAALGGELEVPCLLGGENCDGKPKVKIKVPEGVQTGHTVRLRGRGMPSLRGRDRGDLVVELFVETPTKLTSRQKALLRELAAELADHQTPKSRRFLRKARRFWKEADGEARVEEGDRPRA